MRRKAQRHHGAEGGRGHKKPLSTESCEGVSKRDRADSNANSTAGQIAATAKIAPSAFGNVDGITRIAEQSGWSGPEAFLTGLTLTACGTTVAEARQLLTDSTGRVQ